MFKSYKPLVYWPTTCIKEPKDKKPFVVNYSMCNHMHTLKPKKMIVVYIHGVIKQLRKLLQIKEVKKSM